MGGGPFCEPNGTALFRMGRTIALLYVSVGKPQLDPDKAFSILRTLQARSTQSRGVSGEVGISVTPRILGLCSKVLPHH